MYKTCTQPSSFYFLDGIKWYLQESRKTSKKYHTVRTVPKFNRKIVERQILYL